MKANSQGVVKTVEL